MATNKKEYSEIVESFRKKIWNNGLRYKKPKEKLSGNPEVVFSNYRIVIFCYDDYIHGKNLAEIKESGIDDKSIEKIEKQIKKDKTNESTLKANGWTVVKFWESELFEDLDKCADMVEILVWSMQSQENRRERLLTVTCPACESRLYRNGYICPNCGELVEHLTKEQN